MEDHYQELFEWIEDHALSRSTTNLSLAFADASKVFQIFNNTVLILKNFSPTGRNYKYSYTRTSPVR